MEVGTNMSNEGHPRRHRPRIVIIGGGPGGIVAGHALRTIGHEDFLILERQDRAGGTWARNRYPGLACDIPSHLYSFSFAPKADWSRSYAPQGEILDYMEQCVDSLGLRHHLRLGTGVRSARWDDALATWTVTTEAGDEIVADVVITSTGMFGAHVWPEIEGRDTFAGTSVHTAEWPAGLDLAGRRVAVVGSAASAVQLVPEVARVATQLHLFQRSANWVLPKADTPYTSEQLAEFAADPATVADLRAALLEQFGSGFSFVNAEARRACEELGLGNISVVEDPELRKKLVPTSPWGCQRPLFSNDYYPTFNQPNVELVTDPIAQITPAGIVTADGVERDVDVIIYATGYETTRYISAIDITGRDGASH